MWGRLDSLSHLMVEPASATTSSSMYMFTSPNTTFSRSVWTMTRSRSCVMSTTVPLSMSTMTSHIL